MGGKRPGKREEKRSTVGPMTVGPLPRRAHLRFVAALTVGVGLLALVTVAAYIRVRVSETGAAHQPSEAVARFVGGAICAGCHMAQADAWRGSHHALAMQKAEDATVLGNFNDAQFTYFGVTSHFFRRNGRFFVNTNGRDGEMADFEIAYTFGVFPLQQYLIGFPDGRLQALSIAWDARSKDAGGQRWFHLYPDQPIHHGEVLHWTGLNQNWNFMCAECHATDVHKNYDAAGDRFHTTWSELGVACEACHGPGSRHVAWAEHKDNHSGVANTTEQGKGLVAAFHERAGVTWAIDQQSGQVRRSSLQALRPELETCGRCHARRAELAEDWLPGRSLSSTHLVSLLERGLYHDDGQIEDEVYEYGSFRQSKMFANGVTCSDCHDPHSLERRASGDGVCLQCHSADRYATAKHHFHAAASPPLGCSACHMPSRTYMGVDVRHDHSFRVPRPDLSATLGTPNACNDCHKDRTATWAVDAIERWYGTERKGFQNFAAALHDARQESPDAGKLLDLVMKDPRTTAIARATALVEMAPYLTPALGIELRRGLADADPLVRLGALRGLDGISPNRRWALANQLLDDPARAVRVEATSFLAETPLDSLPLAERQRFERAAQEYVGIQRFNADRPEARVTLGAFFARRGRTAEAEVEYRAAIRLAPNFVQAYVNLADLYRGLGRDSDSEATLRQALSIAPDDAAVSHALGLALVRQRRLSEALPLLAKAAALDLHQSRYAYVYAVALNSSGQREEALRVLKESHLRHKADRGTIAALISFERDAGDRVAALKYAEALAELAPGDPTVTQLIDELHQNDGRAPDERISDPRPSRASPRTRD
jgi:Flp pilus assembly protein TadD